MKLKFAGVLAFLFLLAPGQLPAQGLFEGFAFPKTATATGHTEVAGSIMISLRQGVVTAGTLVIDMSPLRITNTNVADIRVTNLGISVGATTIDTDRNLIRIPVFAGATAGSIRVDGIRVSVAGTGISSANARLYWEDSLNILTSGTNIAVINGVQSGLAADPITDRFVIFNGRIVDGTSTISIREGYAAAFSDSADYGQTVSTRIRIRVTDFPANLQMTFPATVTATNSAASLTTVGGSAVTLTGVAGSNEVTYRFTGVAGSNDLLESFDIPFAVSLVGTVGLTQPTIEVSLAPIGAAVPDSTFPSTDVPRYAQDNIAVQEGTSRIITKVLYWTGINASLQNQVTILNPSSSSSNLTIEAFNVSGQTVSGTGITNPVKLSLSASQSLVRTVSQLFGTTSGASSIRIQSTQPDVLATATVSGSGMNESVPFISRATGSVFVAFVNESAQLHLMNPSSSSTSGTLAWRTAEGRLLGTSSLTLAPLASTTVPLSNSSAGYVQGSFTSGVVAFESFGSTGTLNVMAIQPAASVASLFVPFFALGNGFQTDINLINVSEDTVTLRAQIFNGTGAAVGTALLITMPPGEQLAAAVDRLFSQAPSSGYIKFEVPQLFKAFFPYYPMISGQASIRSSQGGSTVIPLSAYPLQDAFILAAGTESGEFEGIALVNPTTAAVTVTVQAIHSTGNVLSSTSLTLNAGEVVSRLTTDFFAGGVPAQSVIRVTASAPIVTTTLTGTNSLDALRSLPVLR